MRRRAVPIILLAGLVAALFATAAQGQTVNINLGRRGTHIIHPAGAAVGDVLATAQGQLLDDNADTFPDAIRGRAAAKEIRGVKRIRQYYALLKVWRGAWVTVARRDLDLVNNAGSNPAYVVGYTPARALCPYDVPLRGYQVQQGVAVRWNDDRVSNRTVVSFKFRAAPVATDPLCVAPPANADLAVTKRVVDVADPPGDPDPDGIQDVDDNINYVITVTNNGPARATALTIRDTWPAGLDNPTLPANCEFVDPDPTTNVNEVVVCDVVELAAGASTTITIGGRTNGEASGDLVNTVTVGADQPDPVTANNTFTLTTPTV
jgi:uncharacterized repeat protein (TIGR01451 family)